MSTRNQEYYSPEYESEDLYDEVDMERSYESIGTPKQKETEFVDLATAAERHPMNAIIGTNTAVKDKAVIIAKEKETKRRCCSKMALCLSVVMIMVVIASCVCFTLGFLEISRLKSEISSFQKVTATSIASSGEEWCNSVECISILRSVNESYRMIESQTQNSFYMLNQTHSRTENQLQLLNETLTSSLQQSLSLTHQNNLSAEAQFQLLNKTLSQFLTFPAVSCTALLQLHPSSPSGYYWIRSSNGSPIRVYCDMTLSCGGVTGGWMRVANLDMRDSTAQCPATLRERIDSSKRTCEAPSLTRCYEVIYSAEYTFFEVCGKITAYQVGVTDAFDYDFGFDGISLIYGNPRQHIWTFVSAQSEVAHPSRICPCTNINEASSARSPPAFVGNDYFCDTGSNDSAIYNLFYGDDPLWDGAGCGPLSTCCTFNNPPWFYKELPQLTTDDIVMQVCRDASDENIAIETVDIYVR